MVGVSFWIATAMMLASTVFLHLGKKQRSSKVEDIHDRRSIGYWYRMVPLHLHAVSTGSQQESLH